jgi:hypothetical protein
MTAKEKSSRRKKFVDRHGENSTLKLCPRKTLLLSSWAGSVD